MIQIYKRKLHHLYKIVFIIVLLLFMQVPLHTAAKEPGLRASVTKKNVLSLLKEYDSDGAYILQDGIKRKENITVWWSPGEIIVDSIGTAVHEQVHSFTFAHGAYNKMAIYLGNKKYVTVNYTPVYKSKLMSRTIPVRLRTFRWETYIGKPSKYLASNIDGVYGLLNEFSAYYWGMHTEVKLFDYLMKNNASEEMWLNFVNACVNDRQAYAEFKYYILKYMEYAKQKYPNIYKQIVKNKSFINAYSSIEKKFAKEIQNFEKRIMPELCGYLSQNGFDTEITGGYFYIKDEGGASGIGMMQEDYQKLIDEIAKLEAKKLL